MTTSTTSARVVAALAAQLPEAEVVRAVSAFPTWEELVAAPLAARVAAIGSRAARLQLPAVCPELDVADGTLRAVSRFESGYPSRLADGWYQPLVIWLNAAVPDRPYVLVAGSSYPSEAALAAVEPLVADLSLAGWSVATVGLQPLAVRALRSATTMGSAATAVLPVGFRHVYEQRLLLDQVAANGGAVISAEPPASPWTPEGAFRADRLAVSMATALVGLDLGATAAAGSQLVNEAMTQRRTVFAPQGQGSLALAGGSVQLFGSTDELVERIEQARPTNAVR